MSQYSNPLFTPSPDKYDHSAAMARIIARIIDHEGGYVNHPKDPGGATKYGITRATARRFGYRGDMRDLTRDEAEIMYVEILGDAGIVKILERYGFAVAWQYADAVVNHGHSRAVKIFQHAVGAKPDGVFGNKTRAAAANYPATALTVRYLAMRQKFYIKLKTFSTFGPGWCARVSKNLIYAAADLQED